MIEERPPLAASHTPSDDPRVKMLALRLLPPRERDFVSVRERCWDDARDLLARLDAAAPARDDALARWLDEQIAYACLDLRESEREVELNGDRNVTAVADAEWIAGRLGALREVRDRLGATTNTTPEGGTDD